MLQSQSVEPFLDSIDQMLEAFTLYVTSKLPAQVRHTLDTSPGVPAFTVSAAVPLGIHPAIAFHLVRCQALGAPIFLGEVLVIPGAEASSMVCVHAAPHTQPDSIF